MVFDWDSRKARSNVAKHGVSFEEAVSAFWDENARVISARRATKSEEKSYWRFQ